MSRYSLRTGFYKSLKYFVIFLLPVLIDKFIVEFPEIAQLTLGAALVLVLNYLKVFVGVRIP